MDIPMFKAYVEGYQEHLFDQKLLAVQHGFWAGYYQSKRPKPMKTILTQMIQDNEKAKKKKKYAKGEIQRPEVDVATFLEREKRFKAKLKRLE